MSEPTWFRRPSDGIPGTLNPTFGLLDLPVVSGRADEPLLMDGSDLVSHARLLEDVAAYGGVLRRHGVGPGTPVVVRLPADRRSATVLLACARLGAVLSDTADLVVDEEHLGEVTWDLVLQVGRPDPAPAAELPADARWDDRRTVLDLATSLADCPRPVTPAALVAVLGGSTIV